MTAEGRRRLGHYRILSRIGAGGMGQVFLAEDEKLGRQVVLKVLSPELAGDSAHLARFPREARALATLNHPGIVTVYSVEEDEGEHFFTMELVKGTTLAGRISPAGMRSVRSSPWRSRWRRPWTWRTGRASPTATSSRPTSW